MNTDEPFAGERWRVLDTGPGEPMWNMALDEALLEQGTGKTSAVLRFYAWDGPAATFGYLQRHKVVSELTAVRPLIRRCTGGGLVSHEADWTYSVTVPPGHPWYRLKAVASYRCLHEWLQAAFGKIGVATELASVADPVGPGQCFLGAEEADLLLGGRKLAGAAQRRNRHGLLIQGSVQPPPRGVPVEEWRAAMISVLRAQGAVVVPVGSQLEFDVVECTRRLMQTRYLRVEYLQKR
ncbi:MAG: lipoate--protein ligase family protein [Pedosphaera sp.]|nr:lipoate--protein ligase family protein [Pedosphaera sp.]